MGLALSNLIKDDRVTWMSADKNEYKYILISVL